jgi:hypothetical protein
VCVVSGFGFGCAFFGLV